MAVSVRDRLPTSTAWRKVRPRTGPLRRLALGRVPRLAHLAEDLALADDHRVETGGHPEEVRHRGVVVVRVEEVGELVGVDARRSRRGSRARPASPGGTAWRARRSRCGCTWTAARPRRGARRAPATASALGSASGATATRSRSSTGTVRWLRPTTTRDMPGASPWLRPRARRGSVRACRNRGPTANRRPRWNAPRTAALPAPPTARPTVSRTPGPTPGVKRRRSHVARAGLRPPVPTVTTRSPRRTTDMRVNEQLAGSSAEFTQMRRASPASNTAWSTAGTPVAVVASQAPSRSSGSNVPLRHREAPGVGPGPDLVDDRGGDDERRRPRRRAGPRSCGPRSDRRRPPRSADPAPPGSPGSPRSPGDRTRTRRSSGHRRGGVAVAPVSGEPVSGESRRRVAPLLVEGQDLQLDGEVDLAQRHARGRGDDRRGEVQDRA